MDTWGLAIAGISIVLYFVSKRKPFFLLTTGVGIGLVVGAVWAATLINNILR